MAGRFPLALCDASQSDLLALVNSRKISSSTHWLRDQHEFKGKISRLKPKLEKYPLRHLPDETLSPNAVHLFITTIDLLQTKCVRIINKIINMCKSYITFLPFPQQETSAEMAPSPLLSPASPQHHCLWESHLTVWRPGEQKVCSKKLVISLFEHLFPLKATWVTLSAQGSCPGCSKGSCSNLHPSETRVASSTRVSAPTPQAQLKNIQQISL